MRAPYPQAAKTLLRETLLGAARDLLQQRAWSEITMADVAAAAGVSRQTLYNEFGSRDEFGQAFVIDEGEHFLAAVEAAVRANADDARAAVGAALEAFLRGAGEDPLVAILLSDDGTGGMLPFVTTQGMPVVQWATARITAVIEECWPAADPAAAGLLAEALVRLAISHITAPGGSPEQIADGVCRLLGPFLEQAFSAG